MPVSEVRLGDCMDFMRDLPNKFADLAICDPPYQNNDAIGIQNGNKHSANRTNYHQFENTAPDPLYFTELFRVTRKYIIWGGNYFGLKGGAIVWNKHGTAFGEAELAICNTHHSVRIFDFTWNGMLQENMKDKEERMHPTQKPVQLYKWLLKNYAKEGDRILDTHAGSMSSVIACIDGGFSVTAYELDKDYYEAGKKRVMNHMAQLDCFIERPEIIWK